MPTEDVQVAAEHLVSVGGEEAGAATEKGDDHAVLVPEEGAEKVDGERKAVRAVSETRGAGRDESSERLAEAVVRAEEAERSSARR